MHINNKINFIFALMNKDTIERKLKAELIFFQMYIILLIGLVTGNINFLLKYADKSDILILRILIAGFIAFLIVVIMIIKSYISIKKLTKNKKS